jgi:hypothetical protein
VTAHSGAVAVNPFEAALATACVAAVDSFVATFVGELGLSGMLLDPSAVRAAISTELEGNR